MSLHLFSFCGKDSPDIHRAQRLPGGALESRRSTRVHSAHQGVLWEAWEPRVTGPRALNIIGSQRGTSTPVIGEEGEELAPGLRFKGWTKR